MEVELDILFCFVLNSERFMRIETTFALVRIERLR